MIIWEHATIVWACSVSDSESCSQKSQNTGTWPHIIESPCCAPRLLTCSPIFHISKCCACYTVLSDCSYGKGPFSLKPAKTILKRNPSTQANQPIRLCPLCQYNPKLKGFLAVWTYNIAQHFAYLHPAYTVNDARLSRNFHCSIQISTGEQIKLHIPKAALVSPPEIEEPEDLMWQTGQTVTTSKRKQGNSSAEQTAVTKKRGKR